uniref:WRKY19-like zinc finger domain-containing protein n=1 Tax=Hyaloperonospora arabidopsidis (strain Emoy2) TaxID=559515 RepID=M4B3B5_HYAAE
MLSLLNLVIPSSSDVLLSPLTTTSIDDYDPIDYPFMLQSPALEYTFVPPSPAIEYPWMPDSQDLLPQQLTSVVDSIAGPTELIVSHTSQVGTEPMFDPTHCQIKSLSLLYPDSALPDVSDEMPQLNYVDAHELIALFEDTGVPREERQHENQQEQVQQQQLLLLSKKSKGKCAVAGCNTKMQSKGKCIRHGGGRRCVVEGCTRGAQTLRRCKRHGGGARCRVEGCKTSSQGGGLCRAHGGGRLCTAPGCKKGAQRQGKCSTHSSQQCRVDNCSSVARCRGLCNRHKKTLQF